MTNEGDDLTAIARRYADRSLRYSALVRRLLAAWDRGTAASLIEAIAALREHEGLPPVPPAFGEKK